MVVVAWAVPPAAVVRLPWDSAVVLASVIPSAEWVDSECLAAWAPAVVVPPAAVECQEASDPLAECDLPPEDSAFLLSDQWEAAPTAKAAVA